MLKEKLALLSCEEEYQIVQEATSQSPKRKKNKTALAILLGEDEDDDPLRCSLHQKSLINIYTNIYTIIYTTRYTQRSYSRKTSAQASTCYNHGSTTLKFKQLTYN